MFWLKKYANFLTYCQLLKCKFFLCVCYVGMSEGMELRASTQPLTSITSIFTPPHPKTRFLCVYPWLSLNFGIWLVLYQLFNVLFMYLPGFLCSFQGSKLRLSSWLHSHLTSHFYFFSCIIVTMLTLFLRMLVYIQSWSRYTLAFT